MNFIFLSFNRTAMHVSTLAKCILFMYMLSYLKQWVQKAVPAGGAGRAGIRAAISTSCSRMGCWSLTLYCYRRLINNKCVIVVFIFSGCFLTQGGAIALVYMNRTSSTFIYFLMVLCFSVLSRGQLSFLVQVQDGLYLHEAILEVLLCINDKVIIRDGCQLMYL